MKNEYEITGNEVKLALDYRGLKLYATIDLEDLEKVKSLPNKWCAKLQKETQTFYVYGRCKGLNNNKQIHLHRWIMNPSDDLVVDHIDCNGLNNKRENLRVVEQSVNLINRRKVNSATGFKYIYKHENKYTVNVRRNGKQHYLGRFDTIREAKDELLKHKDKYFIGTEVKSLFDEAEITSLPKENKSIKDFIRNGLTNNLSTKLYHDYIQWCSERNELPMSKVKFNKNVENSGYLKKKRNNGYYFSPA